MLPSSLTPKGSATAWSTETAWVTKAGVVCLMLGSVRTEHMGLACTAKLLPQVDKACVEFLGRLCGVH